MATSKTDLLVERGLAPDRLDDSAAVRDWLREKLGLHNLLQAMELEFGKVRFFCTAAMTTTDDHRVHGSIAPFVDWCLNF
ncbi:hypothetical protein [Streptomyces dysideae]|uniref:Uncharacterized protein n=1 Tax=Streptomyces dysideae TaxID=909626 RepID=A0A117S2S1_9ACTN|nr:hypothetical protein [Streptomyces dysideae]KUO22609.1 hypothetical protein AQJ91_03100 [Streptomyces dysideae]